MKLQNNEGMAVKEVRLNWEESQEHYWAIDEIEEKAWSGFDRHDKKLAKAKIKKIEAKIHNETNQYLRQKELVYRDGGYYKTVMVSND